MYSYNYILIIICFPKIIGSKETFTYKNFVAEFFMNNLESEAQIFQNFIFQILSKNVDITFCRIRCQFFVNPNSTNESRTLSVYSADDKFFFLLNA